MKRTLTAILLCLSLLLGGCGSTPAEKAEATKQSRVIFYFDTVVTLTVYSDDDSIQTKIEKVAKNIYGAASVTFAKPALDRIKLAEKYGLANCPVCIAKTQFSFSADAKQYGAVKGFNLQIRDVVLNAGAEMVVAIAGDIIRMPGLPKDPQANHIDFINGEIVGLS